MKQNLLFNESFINTDPDIQESLRQLAEICKQQIQSKLNDEGVKEKSSIYTIQNSYSLEEHHQNKNNVNERSSVNKQQNTQQCTWSDDEHNRFIIGIEMFGRSKQSQIAQYVNTRSVMQVISHSQKFYQKLSKLSQITSEKILFDIKDEINSEENQSKMCLYLKKTFTSINQNFTNVKVKQNCPNFTVDGETLLISQGFVNNLAINKNDVLQTFNSIMNETGRVKFTLNYLQEKMGVDEGLTLLFVLAQWE
ncbi:Myb-like_DNA-binding domain-containing protein [Hexamita inflata]|uniref:Myb-like DNA-binding domain-containing protein n=1 Tax=Hexamita inflata TaxID=28002 RepID=A0AA86NEI1_9EUKA|nr:Myb-like DNA-binding domain-containing protein [Hexamita inflata]